MATFKEIRDSILREVKGRDQSGTLRSAINEAINKAYKYLMALQDWTWARQDYHFATVAGLDENDTATLTPSGTGNVTLTSSEGTVNFTNLGVDSNWVIIEDDIRPISAAGTTTLTLDVGWADTGALTAYDLYATKYSLPATVGKIYNVSIFDGTSRYDVSEISATDFLSDRRSQFNTGKPTRFAILGYTDAGLAQLAFHPLPDVVYMVEVSHYVAATTLSSDSDTPLMPPKWHQAIEGLALENIYQNLFCDLSKASWHHSKNQRFMQEMYSENSDTTIMSVTMSPRARRRWDQDDIREKT